MIKVSLILLCGLLATRLLRRRSAALRHAVLAATILCAGAAPLIAPLVPAVHVPLHPSLLGSTVQPLTLFIPVKVTRPEEDLAASAPATSGFALRAIAGRVLGGIWLGGAFVSMLFLGAGLARLARLAARSVRVTDARWAHLLTAMSRGYGIRREVRLLQSDHPSLLVTWGLRRPTIILPGAAGGWSDDRVRIVLGHELAHIRRRDWISHLASALLRAAYWFNPLVWIACRQLRLESEQACDDAVLALGVAGPDYATHLLEVARAFKQSRITVFPAPAMARPSSLERRVRAMLNTHLVRTPLTRAAGIAIAIALTAITIPLAGLVASAQSSTASFSGVLVDAVGRIMPDTTLVLINVQSKERKEIRSDATAHFAFAGLAAGDYTLEATRPGFNTSQGRMSLEAGQSLVRDVALQVGDLHETITIYGGAGPTPAKAKAAKMINQSGIESCTPPATGGEITPPLKLADRKPTYPPAQQAAGVGTRVEIDTRIGIDGFPKDFRLTTPADPDFVNALIDAVKQWQFSQTKLDCVPVEVTMHVTASFVVQ
ncbi:MAG: carboxypeptidase regulatory-like domain-containing protein [Acidobacteria bacterium]|nr:carboxypeptidase regulatory-like domain-containing protein [Acidobacteriota bacterium]